MSALFDLPSIWTWNRAIGMGGQHFEEGIGKFGKLGAADPVDGREIFAGARLPLCHVDQRSIGKDDISWDASVPGEFHPLALESPQQILVRCHPGTVDRHLEPFLA